MDRTYYQRRTGFTLVHTLLSLSIALMIIFSCVNILRILKTPVKNENLNLYLSVIQIRELLLDAQDIHIQDNNLYYKKDEIIYQIYSVNHLLVKKPGTDILLRDIEGASFVEDDQKVYIHLKWFGKEKIFLIALLSEKTTSN